ncbi:alanine dehydrogenase [Bradyrhizobium sp. USDA 4369]
MKIGLIGSSLRENEHRAPLHPLHFPSLSGGVQRRLIVEKGYGDLFNSSDAELEPFVRGFATRDEILREAELVILAKPMAEDLRAMREGATLWGWLHLVLYGDLADIAIRRRLTVITWEAMYEEAFIDGRPLHTFHENNALAGYSGVLHALGAKGLDGRFGPARKTVIIGHGYAGRGAAIALQSVGFKDLTVFTQRPSQTVDNRLPGVRYRRFEASAAGGAITIDPDGIERRFVEELRSADIIVNCIGQDPESPVMFVTEDEVARLDHPCLIVDISCDPGMGFPFSRTTTFETPTFNIGKMTVCAVDHTPAYHWDAATWGISKALVPHVSTVAAGPNHWRENSTIGNAIEIENGIVLNRKIISFQGRSAAYPFERALAPPPPAQP